MACSSLLAKEIEIFENLDGLSEDSTRKLWNLIGSHFDNEKLRTLIRKTLLNARSDLTNESLNNINQFVTNNKSKTNKNVNKTNQLSQFETKINNDILIHIGSYISLHESLLLSNCNRNLFRIIQNYKF